MFVIFYIYVNTDAQVKWAGFTNSLEVFIMAVTTTRKITRLSGGDLKVTTLLPGDILMSPMWFSELRLGQPLSAIHPIMIIDVQGDYSLCVSGTSNLAQFHIWGGFTVTKRDCSVGTLPKETIFPTLNVAVVPTAMLKRGTAKGKGGDFVLTVAGIQSRKAMRAFFLTSKTPVARGIKKFWEFAQNELNGKGWTAFISRVGAFHPEFEAVVRTIITSGSTFISSRNQFDAVGEFTLPRGRLDYVADPSYGAMKGEGHPIPPILSGEAFQLFTFIKEEMKS